MIAKWKKITKKGRMWLFGLSMLALATAVLVSVLVFANSSDISFTATPYADLVRFEAGDPVATLQLQIYDLSGKKVWDSGVVSGGIVDWGRTNKWDERLAYGPYIYVAQGWSADGGLVLHKKGKLVLLPGDKVQLQVAPPAPLPSEQKNPPSVSDTSAPLHPMMVDFDHSTESWAFGQLGIGTTSPTALFDIAPPGTIATDAFSIQAVDNHNAFQLKFLGHAGGDYHTQIVTDRANSRVTLMAGIATDFAPRFHAVGAQDVSIGTRGWVVLDYGSHIYDLPNAELRIRHYNTTGTQDMARFIGRDRVVFPTGNVGIGTTTPAATLEVHGSATNLFALYDPATPTDPKFRVEKTGTVYADGAYYGAGYYTGSADVAERINTSEWVEKGDVVEIDPDHPGFFRKARSPYSTRVAGIISTSPGVVLGNSFNASADQWKDNRPVLAITGRVPVKATTENGPIKIGDLLASSSTPGYAMRCDDPRKAVGAVVGKAMEPLEKGTGVIMVQVMLR